MNVAHVIRVLTCRGFACAVENRFRYTGEPLRQAVPIVTAYGDGVTGIASDVPNPEMFQELTRVQEQVPNLCKIVVLEQDVVLFNKARGDLLWHFVQRPPVDKIAAKLKDLTAGLRAIGLVHADIRPWNVFFDPTDGTVTVIDLGFSFFAGARHKSATAHLAARGHGALADLDIDARDVELTLAVLMGETSVEDAWKHHNDLPFLWHPPWCRK